MGCRYRGLEMVAMLSYKSVVILVVEYTPIFSEAIRHQQIHTPLLI